MEGSKITCYVMKMWATGAIGMNEQNVTGTIMGEREFS